MRAIKIDPVAKTITEIELAQNPNETLQELYGLIGCDLVELVQLDRGIIMAVDESVFAQGYAPTRKGKLKEVKGGFTFLGWGTVIGFSLLEISFYPRMLFQNCVVKLKSVSDKTPKTS